MKNVLLFFILGSLPWPAAALLPEMSLWRVGAQINLVGSQDINQAAMEWAPALGLEVGLEFEPWSLGLAWRHMESDSDSGIYHIESDQERVIANGRRSWHGDTDWLAWFQAGVGFQWSKVDMSLGAQSESVKSDEELVLGLGLGFGWPLDQNWRSELAAEVHQTQTRSANEASASASLVRLF